MSDRLTVEVEGLQAVEVYNLMGQLVISTSSSVLDFSELNQGIYFVRVKADGRVATQRVVKQ